ncbi:hypothetical protein [Pseudonocardia sp. ICBG1293]|nr:hypothetical protein [Pseudonocardia sp. ICBG1293]
MTHRAPGGRDGTGATVCREVRRARRPPTSGRAAGCAVRERWWSWRHW